MKKYITIVLLFMTVLTAGKRGFALTFRDVTSVSPGINFGRSTETGHHIGADLSIEKFYGSSFTTLAGYGDFLWSGNEFRSSMGAGFRLVVVGIDVGVLGVFPREGNAGIKAGLTTRLIAACSFGGIYGRYNYFPGDSNGYIEFGVLLRYPIKL
ncbi:MAG: hypothetical protein GY754_04990 [bacterium]|nr:hypothetical protein [bacterium]